MSYRNITYDSRNKSIHIFTWDDNGNRIKISSPFEPYLYIEGKGEYESIYGTKLIKKTFPTLYDRMKFVNEGGNKRLFENLPPIQQYLIDTYWQVNESSDFSKNDLKIYFFDIETYSKDDFPNVNDPKDIINVITIFCSLRKKFITWGLKDYTGNSSNLVYHKCKDEKDLLRKFIEFIQKDHPDILTGWNSVLFDVPYVCSRVTRILGEQWTNKLSPVNKVYYRSVKGEFGREQIRWTIDGVSSIDYLDVYKRFTMSIKESYKLDYIGELELGEKKVDYGNQNLADLSDNDWNLFIDYNIQDVKLLVDLEEKLKYLNLVRMLGYIGLTTFEGALGTLNVINGSAAIWARYKNQKMATFVRNKDEGKNPGAFVGQPYSGFKNHIVSFDANSLYPNVMISLNMSPETKVGKIVDKNDNKYTVKLENGKSVEFTKQQFLKAIESQDLSISKANVLFTQKKKGLLPEILEFYYNKRQEIKKDLKKYKKQYSESPSKKTKYIIDQLDAKQLCIKVFINSIYGYMGNKNAPFGDDDIASSITLTGQSVIKQSNEIIKNFIKDKTDIDKEMLEECIIYNDTDSNYISLSPIVNNNKINFVDENNTITTEFYNLVKELEDYLNETIKVWGSKAFNSHNCTFVFKREIIAKVGVFLQKKRYVLNILDDEGIKTDKFKYVGVEVVRSTMPNAIKPYVKKIVETMLLTQDYKKTNEVLNETYQIFKQLPVEDITFISGIKGYEKYAGQCDGFNTVKGMPIHVKSAYFHNLLLDRFNISNKYEKIRSGDKVRYFYVQQPNPYNLTSIGYKYYYPDEFNKIFKVDYDTMFNKVLFAGIERFYDNVQWKALKPGQAVQTDLFELLS